MDDPTRPEPTPRNLSGFWATFKMEKGNDKDKTKMTVHHRVRILTHVPGTKYFICDVYYRDVRKKKDRDGSEYFCCPVLVEQGYFTFKEMVKMGWHFEDPRGRVDIQDLPHDWDMFEKTGKLPASLKHMEGWNTGRLGEWMENSRKRILSRLSPDQPRKKHAWQQ